MSRHQVVLWPVACLVVLAMAAAPAVAEHRLTIGKRVRLTTVDPPGRPNVADTLRALHENEGRVTISLGDGPITWTKNREWLQGDLVASDPRHLTVRVDRQSEPLVIRREDVTALDVWDASRSRGKGALVGGAVGLGLGAVMGLASGDDQGGLVAFSAGQKALILGILMTPLGALIGLAVAPERDWRNVPLDRLRMTLGRTPEDGARISMNVSF